MRLGRYHRTLLLATVVGVAVGLFATGFRMAWKAGLDILWSGTVVPWHRIVVSTVAGVLIGGIGMLTHYPGSLAAVVRDFHEHGAIPSRDNVPVVPSNFLGLIAGQGAGPEGMMSVVGGSLGTRVGDRLDAGGRKLLTLAGMGAGFGTILGAPIGGSLLWLELPHRRGIEYYEAIVPTLVASFSGYLVMVSLGGLSLFNVWEADLMYEYAPFHLAAALLVGVAAVPLGHVYNRVFSAVGRLFNRYSPRLIVRTTLAGLGIGLLGYALPLTYFYGGNQINAVLNGNHSLALLVAVLGGEMIAAALTIQGNWHGGLIIPHMFMGAVLGQALSLVVPGLPAPIAMLTGMAAFNATVTGTPLSSALIAISLTNGAAIVPVFLGSLASFVVGPSVGFVGTEEPRREQTGPLFALDDDEVADD
ncbi:chloride channel protein [Halolamina sp. CBA1230]|uniref:chloride channel protein n=1 Tax=Halolamina sp. CBA1230 TaxID=1853690 RepID=UPI0009A1EA2F|nr:chloride channel protein [Halolamina sp. CBA1230]QKY20884.1 chloride channel protein [Halolamina sp. CBA1230]